MFYISVSEDFGRNAQPQSVLRAKACKENLFSSKGYFSSPEDMKILGFGFFFWFWVGFGFFCACGKEYASVVECCVWRKRLKTTCRIFSCLCKRLNASLSGLTEVMTVIGIIYVVEWLSESLICSYLSERSS